MPVLMSDETETTQAAPDAELQALKDQTAYCAFCKKDVWTYKTVVATCCKVCDHSITSDATEIREAKRVAAIAESMNLIRTLNSRGCTFNVSYRKDGIILFTIFEIDNNATDVVKFKIWLKSTFPFMADLPEPYDKIDYLNRQIYLNIP